MQGDAIQGPRGLEGPLDASVAHSSQPLPGGFEGCSV